MSVADDTGRDDDALAAEYALGLLDGAERDTFEARLLVERGLADLVADWQEQLAPMAEEIAPVRPRAAVKVGVMDRVFADRRRRPGFFQRAGLWQSVSFASLAGAAALGYMIYTQPPPGAGPIFVVDISAEDRSLQILAAADADGENLRLQRRAGAAESGRVLQLWAIAGNQAPVSLGVLPDSGETVIELPEALRGDLLGLTLAVSDEPSGGSPTGQPTGAVLAVGQITDL